MEFSKEKNILKVAKVFDEAIIPTRGTAESAGIDLYIPKFSISIQEILIRDAKSVGVEIRPQGILVLPHNSIKINTGIKVEIPSGTALIAKNKSGVSINNGVTKLAELIDSDYTGPVYVTLANYTNSTVELQWGQKIIQVVHIPVIMDDIIEVSIKDIHSRYSERGAGAFGSTGK